MRFLIFPVILLWSKQLGAQHNGDCVIIASLHIKTATGYTVSLKGDTSFLRYSYDRQGRVWKTESCWETCRAITCYDTIGNETSYFKLCRPYPFSAHHRGSNAYDTISKSVTKYDSATARLSYSAKESYNGKGYWAVIKRVSNDTTYFYTVDSTRNHTCVAYNVRTPVDSIKLGHAEVHYYIHKGDTGFACSKLYVYDSVGNPIRYYNLATDPNNRGARYNPVQDTAARLYLTMSIQHEYDDYGYLVKSTCTDHPSGRVDVHGYPEPWQLTLEEIKQLHHKIIFEYYE